MMARIRWTSLCIFMFLPSLSSTSAFAFVNMGMMKKKVAVFENLALASKGTTASGSSTYGGANSVYGAAGTINGDRTGSGWGSGGGWNDDTNGSYPDYLELRFATMVSLTEVDVFSIQDSFSSPSAPTSAMTFTLYGLIDFKIQYDNSGTWTDIPGASVSSNNKVWVKFTFASITTSRIRLLSTSGGNSYSRVAEIEAWGYTAGALTPETRTNYALASNGSTASASSVYGAGYEVANVINGDRMGSGWGSGGGWQDGTSNTYPDWVEINFGTSRVIGEVDVFGIQDNYNTPQVPIDTMVSLTYGLTDFNIQYWDGSAWQAIPGASVTSNVMTWRKFTFTSIATTKIRLNVTNASNGYSRVIEIEAWSP